MDYINKVINWIKSNKITTILIVVVIYLIFSRSSSVGTSSYSRSNYYGVSKTMESMPLAPQGLVGSKTGYDEAAYEPSYNSGGTNTTGVSSDKRKVVTNSNISLLVKDVSKTLNDITQETEKRAGYVVNTSMAAPGESANGYITIRVPVEDLKSMLDYLKGISVKVVSVTTSGNDITDTFVDTQARLETLYKTKGIFENMLSKATNVEEIMNVQEKILYTQDQIDNLMGQLKYMEATSSTTLISINLSTDELELPYAPDQPWRPNVVFKYAVRSLVVNLRSLGSAIIWVGVYSIIWVPIIAVIFIIKKVKNPNRKIK